MRRLLPYIFACLLAMSPAAHAIAAPLLQTQSAPTYQGIVNTTANIRSGPGTQYEIVGQAQSGQSVTVVACNSDCTWYKLDNGNWIAAFLVDLVASTGDATSANSNGDNNSGNNRGSRTRAIDPDDLVLDNASPAALEIVAKILSYTGLPQNFDVYSANIYNAAALMVRGKRVILYDPQLIADIESVTEHDWPAVSILAHEIGHHLAGHTLAETYNREYELEADYFSGFILQKMGANLAEAQAVMSLLRDHPNMTDHPPQAERLAAIERGWQEAARQQGLAWEPDSATLADEAKDEIQVGVVGALQRAYAQEMAREDAAAAFALKDWSVGLRALITTTEEQ